MKNKLTLLMALTAMFLTLFVTATPVSAQIANGTHKVSYEVKEASNNNTSIADGYFSKPATLIVEGGTQYVQLTITSADMIKSLSTPAGPVSILSENKTNDTRTVKFKVNGDLSQPVKMDMHIVVPDLYDMKHTARAVFNVSGLPQASSVGAQKSTDKETTATSTEKEIIENPQTGDSSSIGLYAILMLGSLIALFSIWKLRPVRN